MKKAVEERSVLKTILAVIGIISGILSVLFFLFLFFIIIASFSAPTTFNEGNIAIIPIDGVITTGSAAFGETGVASGDVVQWIHEAEEDDHIKAVIFRINSPGGTPVATEEIASEINGMIKPSVAVIREMGASGAYWAASATDKIFASRLSMVGSIGVLASYLEFAGTLERYNATYQSLTAGEFKETGSPFKHLTRKEEDLFQGQLDKIHDVFIKAVAENRGLPEDKVRKIATGWVYLGSEALELGLIDKIGTEEDAIASLEESLNITAEIVEFSTPLTFMDELFGVTNDFGFSIGSGIGQQFTKLDKPQVWT